MDFLTKRHIYHGDLATRNVLLTDSLDVKISDFGLSKRLYRELSRPQALRSTNEGKTMALPIKWLPLETLLRQEFVPIKTDVWSFGVLAWEIFTLGNEPYRGIQYFSLVLIYYKMSLVFIFSAKKTVIFYFFHTTF